MDVGTAYGLGVLLVFIGMIIVLVAVVLHLIPNTKGKTKAKAGGVIIIGPIPIVFGTDKESIKKVLLLSVALTILLLIVIVTLHLLSE